MGIDNLEKCFVVYLNESWKIECFQPFLLSYIKLLLLFESELTEVEVGVLSERKKQLHGEVFDGDKFEELLSVSRKRMNMVGHEGAGDIRGIRLKRLLFCALLDTGEPDFFYFTEPMFEFSRGMDVTVDQLRLILESEFVGFKSFGGEI